MHSESDNIKFMIYNNTEVIEGLFESRHSRLQIGLEISMRVCEFVLECVHLLY